MARRAQSVEKTVAPQAQGLVSRSRLLIIRQQQLELHVLAGQARGSFSKERAQRLGRCLRRHLIRQDLTDQVLEPVAAGRAQRAATVPVGASAASVIAWRSWSCCSI